jgi:F-type H+-transporting ATPase subunit beta
MITVAAKKGHITQVIGSTFDVEFEGEHLPDIYNAVTIKAENKGISLNLVGEVQQHIGGSRVRCVALGSTDGLMRGMEAIDTGGPVQVPVGMETLGRVFNLLGQGHRPLDAAGAWRQGRPVRRGWPRQDGYSHGTDRPYRQGLQGLLGIRRRRRTNPRG